LRLIYHEYSVDAEVKFANIEMSKYNKTNRMKDFFNNFNFIFLFCLFIYCEQNSTIQKRKKKEKNKGCTNPIHPLFSRA